MPRNYNNEVSAIISATWSDRESKNVPTTESVKLAGGAVYTDATFLYSDLARSTELVEQLDHRVAAKLIKSFVQCSVHLIQEAGGKVISFDGDRTLGVFTENWKNSRAVECGLKIKFVLNHIIDPRFRQEYPQTVGVQKPLSHCVGIDTGKVFVVRAGARGQNDLLTIGSPANLAAKLSDLRDGEYNTYITPAVYKVINEKAKFSSGVDMWEQVTRKVSGKNIIVYRSNYYWKVN
jgi:adenylate cyclase